MKIYSFETITSIEDVRQIPSYVPLGEQSILIPPSFPWIKDKLQDIAISLYNFDWEKLPTLIDALKTKTFEFTSQLTGEQPCHNLDYREPLPIPPFIRQPSVKPNQRQRASLFHRTPFRSHHLFLL